MVQTPEIERGADRQKHKRREKSETEKPTERVKYGVQYQNDFIYSHKEKENF